MKKICTVLIAFLLALCLLALCVTQPLKQFPASATGFLYNLGDGLLDTQLAHVHAAMEQQAERYGFDAERIKAMVTADTLRTLNAEAADWYAGLLSEGFEGDEPYVGLDGLEDAISSDPGFQETVDPALWQSTARDEVAPAIEKALKASVYPLRASLLGMGRSMADGCVDVPALLAKIPRYRTYLLTAAAVLALLLLLVRRKLWGFCKWLGVSVAAAGCMGCVLALLTWLLRIPQQAAAISEIGGLVCVQFFAVMRPYLLWLPLGMLLIGEILVWLAARREARQP